MKEDGSVVEADLGLEDFILIRELVSSLDRLFSG